MRKIILSAFMLMGLAFGAQAQDISKNAIGLRLGDNDGFGGEVSYQRKLFKSNRIEADLGWTNSSYYDAVKLVGLYQWVWDIDKGFNWYAGAGGGFGTWNYNGTGTGNSTNGTILLASGDVGIEYNFSKVPIQLFCDFRPELYLNNTGNNKFRRDSFGPGFGLGARYRF